MVLVQLVVDRRHLALAEGVVERVVDGAALTPRRAARVAVDVDDGLDAVVLLVGVDVGQRGRACFIASASLRAQVRRSATLSLLSVYW